MDVGTPALGAYGWERGREKEINPVLCGRTVERAPLDVIFEIHVL